MQALKATVVALRLRRDRRGLETAVLRRMALSRRRWGLENILWIELGTLCLQGSWNAVYERELQTFQEYGDTGEIWFGEESMTRLIRWMQKHKIPLDASVLDIGTGNGVFLVELAKFGFSDITGIDYSPSAIQLSGSIIEKEGLSNIKLKVEDFLNLSTKLSGFQICIDKGTFDAISLNPDNAIEKRKQYVKSLSVVLKAKGFFLITSCNWTKEELLNEFSEGNILSANVFVKCRDISGKVF